MKADGTQFPIKVSRKNANGEIEIVDAILEVGDGKDVLWRLIVDEDDVE